MDLKEDQIIVFNKLLEFLNNDKNEILINSSAGTGKTFLITYFIKHIILNNTIDKNISVCTPTHTSLQELKSKLFKDNDNFDKSRVNLSTIHRFLDYKQKIDKNNEKYFSRNKKSKLNWNKYGLLIIDECSMLNDDICNDITEQVMKIVKTNNFKVIYIGDISQLNPINQNKSNIFKKDIENLKLNKIIRTNNNKIMDICNSHKKWDLENIIPNLAEHISKNVVVLNNKKEWLKKFKKEFFKSQNNIILCWTNKNKDYYNNYMRKKIFKKDNLEKYEINEILIFSDFHKIIYKQDDEEKEVYFKSSQQFIIKDIIIENFTLNKITITKTSKLNDKLNNIIINNLEIVNNYLDETFKIYKMKIIKNNINNNMDEEIDNNIYEIFVIHNDDDKNFENIKSKCIDTITDIKIQCYKEIKESNNKNEIQNEIENKIIKIWNMFNLIIEVIAKINYSYAITVHLSQSKTYNNVYIDINNILENQNLSEKKKLIYTALTRASNSLKLLIEN